AEAVVAWLGDPAAGAEAGRQAGAVVARNRGAVDRILALLPGLGGATDSASG
ncbi:hypothetical protein H0Z60_19820, partial [Ectothiorhodospiraceae bacterium WFHF3C12]|nr:hypothetical protein [Ectothiorhodospiraceae bacterium WFHF3C12]